MNSRKMKKAMKKMGIKQKDIECEKVIIIQDGQRIIIDNPSVQKVDMMGQKTYQISGDETVEEDTSAVEITEDDIETVVAQSKVSKAKAKKALEENNGDIAEAILSLQD